MFKWIVRISDFYFEKVKTNDGHLATFQRTRKSEITDLKHLVSSNREPLKVTGRTRAIQSSLNWETGLFGT